MCFAHGMPVCSSTRDLRAQSAPGFPCALCQREGQRDCKTRAKSRREIDGSRLRAPYEPRVESPQSLPHMRPGTVAETCMTSRVDFTSPAYFRNPAASLEKLRHRGPVVEVSFPIVGKVWATTTQALADRVLKDTDIFTVRKEDGDVAGMRWWMPPIVRTFAKSMLSMDEPDHKRLRDIVDEAFRRRAVLGMEPHIQKTAERLAGELFAAGSPADLIERYARVLPLAVICELLGLPEADRPKFMAWAGQFARFTGALGFLLALPKVVAMKSYIEAHVEAVRRDGGEGLIAELVRVEREGGRISREEIVSMMF